MDGGSRIFDGGEGDPVFDSATHAEDWAAFANLIEPLRAKLHRCIGLLIGDLDEAASLVQEAFTRCGAERSKLTDQAPIYPWLRGIGVNLAKQYLERRARQAQPRDLGPGDVGRPVNRVQHGVLTEILRDELATKVWLAIGQLPEAYREAIVLHYLDGMEYAQIAELTGVSEGALRARALRGRNLLRGSLGSIVDTWMRQG